MVKYLKISCLNICFLLLLTLTAYSAEIPLRIITVNDFMAEGGDNYIQFKKAREVQDTGIKLRELLLEKIKEAGCLNYKEYFDRLR